MIRIVVFAAVAVSTLAVVGCGGGHAGSVRYAPTVVPIKHLDLPGVELTPSDYAKPRFAFVSQYPSIVAEVNGQPVAGQELVRMQMTLEFQRRGAVEALLSIALVSPGNQGALQERTNAQVQAIGSTDPLEAAIDQVLERQGAKRLELVPSAQEAIDLARQAQQDAEKALASASPEQRAAFEESLRVQGLLDTDWTRLPGVVEAIATERGLMALHRAECDKRPAPDRLSYTSGYDCSAFLAQERENADIVYFVRWAD